MTGCGIFIIRHHLPGGTACAARKVRGGAGCRGLRPSSKPGRVRLSLVFASNEIVGEKRFRHAVIDIKTLVMALSRRPYHASGKSEMPRAGSTWRSMPLVSQPGRARRPASSGERFGRRGSGIRLIAYPNIAWKPHASRQSHRAQTPLSADHRPHGAAHPPCLGAVVIRPRPKRRWSSRPYTPKNLNLARLSRSNDPDNQERRSGGAVPEVSSTSATATRQNISPNTCAGDDHQQHLQPNWG